MLFRILLILTAGILYMTGAVNASAKHHNSSPARPVEPELTVANGPDTADAKRRIDTINKSVVNHSKFAYSSVALTLAFYDEKDKLIRTDKFTTSNLAPGAVWKVAVPVSFLGIPPIAGYDVLSLAGARSGKSIVSYTMNGRNDEFHFHTPLIDVTLDPASYKAYSHYTGPTVDSLFTNPDLRLLQADFAPANKATFLDADPDPDEITSVTGIIENASEKTYDYVEVNVNAYDYEGGTQIDSSLAHTTSLAPHEKWRFVIHFLNGKEAHGWRITKIAGHVAQR